MSLPPALNIVYWYVGAGILGIVNYGGYLALSSRWGFETRSYHGIKILQNWFEVATAIFAVFAVVVFNVSVDSAAVPQIDIQVLWTSLQIPLIVLGLFGISRVVYEVFVSMRRMV